MIAHLKPYPTMKDSGVSWLGKVPEHWEVLPNRALFTEVKERDHPDEQMLSVTITKGVIRQQALLADSSKKDSSNQDKSAYKLVKPGDIAYNKMRAWQGAIGASDYRGIVSPAYVVQRPRENADARYLHHLLRTSAFAKEAERWSYGITSDMWSLRPEHFKMIYCSLPTKDEQAAIVRFLDYADRRIKRYILAKQKLIKLLEEQKQAIVHRAVTRGLPSTGSGQATPNVRLKPSGVEWLGDVPEHWEVPQIRSVAQVVRGGSPRPAGSSLYFNGTAAPWITVGEITKAAGMYLIETSTRLTAAGAERSRMIEAGTLLLTNSGATLGVPKISMIQGCINDGVAAFLKLSSRVNKEFLCLYWSTQTIHLKAWVDLGAQPNLNTQIIGGWPVPLPPNEEQKAIVQYIRHETALLAGTTERAEREISLLREYRTRLIADVVTGKLDVRAAAGKLPDENDESESLDDAGTLPGEDDSAEGADLDAVHEEAEA